MTAIRQLVRKKMHIDSLKRIVAVALLFLAVTAMARARDDAFTAWIQELKVEARERGISEATLEAALSELELIDRVIKLDRNQPEFKLDLSTYLGKTVSSWRIMNGRRLLRKHQTLLENVGQRYGIPPRFLVAFWGIESNYGRNSGSFPVISALATLAYDARRSDFFRMQLLDALAIVDEGHVSLQDLRGSWAGATGQLQFMPSTFTRYAEDGDSDGRIDIWHNLPDVMASAANFLSSAGWQRGLIWGREVIVPADLDRRLTGPENWKPLSEWQALGVRRTNGQNLPEEDIEGAVIFPADAEQPAFLVYHNFNVIMKWNRSIFYAIAVGHLADRIIGQGPLQTLR